MYIWSPWREGPRVQPPRAMGLRLGLLRQHAPLPARLALAIVLADLQLSPDRKAVEVMFMLPSRFLNALPMRSRSASCPHRDR